MLCENYIHMLNMRQDIPPLPYQYNKYNMFYLLHVHYDTAHSVCFFCYMAYIVPFDLVRMVSDSVADFQSDSVG